MRFRRAFSSKAKPEICTKKFKINTNSLNASSLNVNNLESHYENVPIKNGLKESLVKNRLKDGLKPNSVSSAEKLIKEMKAYTAEECNIEQKYEFAQRFVKLKDSQSKVIPYFCKLNAISSILRCIGPHSRLNGVKEERLTILSLHTSGQSFRKVFNFMRKSMSRQDLIRILGPKLQQPDSKDTEYLHAQLGIPVSSCTTISERSNSLLSLLKSGNLARVKLELKDKHLMEHMCLYHTEVFCALCFQLAGVDLLPLKIEPSLAKGMHDSAGKAAKAVLIQYYYLVKGTRNINQLSSFVQIIRKIESRQSITQYQVIQAFILDLVGLPHIIDPTIGLDIFKNRCFFPRNQLHYLSKLLINHSKTFTSDQLSGMIVQFMKDDWIYSHRLFAWFGRQNAISDLAFIALIRNAVQKCDSNYVSSLCLSFAVQYPQKENEIADIIHEPTNLNQDSVHKLYINELASKEDFLMLFAEMRDRRRFWKYVLHSTSLKMFNTVTNFINTMNGAQPRINLNTARRIKECRWPLRGMLTRSLKRLSIAKMNFMSFLSNIIEKLKQGACKALVPVASVTGLALGLAMRTCTQLILYLVNAVKIAFFSLANLLKMCLNFVKLCFQFVKFVIDEIKSLK